MPVTQIMVRIEMRFSRAWRRRAEPTIADQLAVVTDSVEELASAIFMSAVANDVPMPSRASVETAVKGFMMEFLEPAREQAIKSGRPAAEVEAYAEIVTSHAQVAFQTKWAELELHRVTPAPFATGLH